MAIEAQDRASAAINAVAASLGRLDVQAKNTTTSLPKIAGGMAIGTVAAQAFIGAITTVTGGLVGMGAGALDLASKLEQAKIGFTTMLGDAKVADAFIRKLQAFAENTAFDFPGIQQAAQSFLAMGVDAKNVIPIIQSVSNALAAAGKGGDTEALKRVGFSLAEIQAQGKVTGEQLRELARNGIAVLPMLASAFGTTTAEIRKLAENGEISANQFFEAFTSESARRYGDIQAEQAKTWAVAITNVSDTIGRMATETLAPFFSALTKGALLMQEFLKSEQARQWAADLRASITDVMTLLAPLGAALRQLLGLGAEGPEVAVVDSSAAEDIKAATTVPAEAIASARDYKAEIAAASETIRGVNVELTGLTAQQDALKIKIQDTTRHYELQLVGLRDQQDALNLKIEATKTKWEGVIAPLERTQAALERLATDTRADFAAIMDPLKTQLDQVNDKIADSKAAYEAAVKPIQSQIDAINKATAALTKQRRVQQDLNDLALRQKALNALGDPNQRAAIASQLKGLEFNREDLERQKELLELSNKKGRNDKLIEGIQRQIDQNKRAELETEHRLAGLVDRRATIELAGQTELNDAKREQLSIDEGRAKLAGEAQTAPLEEQLATAKAQMTTLLEPLEAQARALSKMVEDTAKAEAAALAPIAAAQESVARKIEDANAAMKAALAPLEAYGASIVAKINETEAAQRRALDPLKEQMVELDRQRDALELKKQRQQDNINLWKEEQAEIKKTADEITKIPAPLNLAAVDTPELPEALVGRSMVPPETIQGFKDLAANVQLAADSMNNLNAAMSGGAVGGLVALGQALAAFVAVGWVIGFLQKLALGLTGAGLAATASQIFWTAWALFVVGSIDTVRKEWEATDWVKMQADWDNWLAGLKASLATWETERTAAWNQFWADVETTAKTAWTNFKTEMDTQHAVSSTAWNTWNTERTVAWNKFWADLGGTTNKFWTDFTSEMDRQHAATSAAWKRFTEGLVGFFNPLLTVIESVANALRGLHMPDWLRHILPGVPPAGGATAARAAAGGTGGIQRVVPGGTGSTTSAGTHGGHPAIDIFALKGTPIHAPVGGTSTPAYYSLGGNATIIAGDDGKFYYFAHGNIPFTAGRVSAGQQIGQVGDTGNARGTSPHLHAAVASSAALFSQLNGSGDFDPVEVFNQISAAAGGMGDAIAAASAKAKLGLDTIMAPIRTAGTDLSTTLAEGIGQGDTVVTNAVKTIVDAAIANGIDPLIALALAKAESGLNPAAVGDKGASVGLFQLHERGQGAGMSFAERADPTINANKFLASHKELYAQLVQSGLAGEELARTFGVLAEVPLDKSGDAYAAAFRELNVQLGSTATAGSALSGTTTAMTAEQAAAAEQAARFAAESKLLSDTLAGQAPATTTATDALTAMSAAIAPIERSVAAGSTPTETLQTNMLDLARATGLNTEAWGTFNSGAATSSEAMEQLIRQSAGLGPQFQDIATYLDTAGASSTEAALKFLQAIIQYQKVTPAVTAVGTATDKTATETAQATTALQGLNAGFAGLNTPISESVRLIKEFEAAIAAIPTSPLEAQAQAWNSLAKQIYQAAAAVGDYNEELSDAPDEAPSAPEAPSTELLPQIGSFAKGGTVPGPVGKPMLAMVHGGELIIPPGRVAKPGTAGGGGDTYVVNLTVNGDMLSELDWERKVASAISSQARGGRLFL